MFEPVKKCLNRLGFDDVVGEVKGHDVVGVNTENGEAVIIEMKRQLNFKVLEQATLSFGRSKYVYVAIPAPANGKTANGNHSFAHRIMKDYGIGLIHVSKGLRNAKVIIRSKEHKVTKKAIQKFINEASRMSVGGAKTGVNPTMYSLTMERVKEKMKSGEWLTANEILDGLKTHWASPKQSLVSELRQKYNLDWCENSHRGRTPIFRLIK